MNRRYRVRFLDRIIIKTVVVCCFLCPQFAFSQTQRIDSLKKQLLLKKTPLQKVETLFELCNQSYSMHSDSFLFCINEAKKTIQSLNRANLLVQLKYYEALYLTRQSKYDVAFEIIESQLPLVNKKEYATLRNKFLLARTRLLIITNKQKEAIQESINLLQEAEKDGDIRMQIIVPIQIGWAYMELGQNEEALNWFHRAKEKYEKRGSVEKSFAACYSNIAAIYCDLLRIDSAEFYVIKAIEVSKREQHLAALANCYYIYSDICLAKNNNAKAEDLLQQGLQIRKQIGDVFYIVSDLSQLGIFYANNKQTEKGIAVIEEGIALAQKNNLFAKLPFLYNALAQNYKAANDYKNYAITLNKVIELKDSLYQRNKAEALQEIQIKYDVQKKETLIAQQKLGLFQRNLLLYGVGIIVLLLSIFFAYQFKKYKQNQKIIAEQKKIQNDLAVKDAEEKERKRIAAELHDNLGVQANAILHNSTMLNLHEKNNKALIADLQETAKEMLLNLRETLWAMKTTDVPARDLWLRIINFMKQMGRHYTSINFIIEGEVPNPLIIASSQALQIVLIIQESVNNSVKHANANTIAIKSIIEDKGWKIILADDGKGFEIEEAKNKIDSYGLANMLQRAKEGGFEYDIKSALGKGTATSLKINY
jgi:two-component system, NarL family, sensor kinase